MPMNLGQCQMVELIQGQRLGLRCPKAAVVFRKWLDPIQNNKIEVHVVVRWLCQDHSDELDQEVSNGTISLA